MNIYILVKSIIDSHNLCTAINNGLKNLRFYFALYKAFAGNPKCFGVNGLIPLPVVSLGQYHPGAGIP